MSLFDRLGGARPNTPNSQPNAQQSAANMREALEQAARQMQQNYASAFQQRGYTVPEGMTDPEQMARHLVQSGQVPEKLFQAAQAAVQTVFGRR